MQDLTLVSQLEYEIQPLHKSKMRLSEIIRSYLADLLNADLSESYSIDMKIFLKAENISFDCNERLICGMD